MFFLLAMMLIVSCSDKDGKDQFIVDTSITMTVKDANGNDLLDPEYTASLDKNSIKLFYVVAGVAKEVYDGNLDYPRMFKIDKHINEYRITIFPNTTSDDELAVTLVQWRENEIDTLSCKVFQGGNRETVTEVWLNGVLKWKDSELTERFFEITK